MYNVVFKRLLDIGDIVGIEGFVFRTQMGEITIHVDGGVPNIRLSISRLEEETIGELIYFFEVGCGISGYVLEVNPFNQPGVEAYKKNMFALLNKPGYENESKAIQERLKK